LQESITHGCRYSKRHPQFDLRSPLHRLTGGAELSQVDSISSQAALQIIAEIGTDMSRWKRKSTLQHGMAGAGARQ
jgi:hypothetical protein